MDKLSVKEYVKTLLRMSLLRQRRESTTLRVEQNTVV